MSQIKYYNSAQVIYVSFFAPTEKAPDTPYPYQILVARLSDGAFFDFYDSRWRLSGWTNKAADMSLIGEKLWRYSFTAGALGANEFHIVVRDPDDGYGNQTDYDGGLVITSGVISDLVSDIWNASATIITGCTSIGGLILIGIGGKPVEAHPSSQIFDTSNITDTGKGSIIVNHNQGGYNNLAYYDAAGNPIQYAAVEVYLTADLNAGRHYDSYCQGSTVTGDKGQWLSNIHLDPGDYTAMFIHPDYEPVTKRFILTAPLT